MPEQRFGIVVNGSAHSLNLPGDVPLLDVLRTDLGLPGTRTGCLEGDCGACTVLVDGQAVQACKTPLWSVAGRAALPFSDTPAITVKIIATPGDAALGAGGVATGPTAAALGNALAHALGLRVRRMPLTLDRIRAAIEDE